MLDGRFDHHFLEVFARSQDTGNKEHRSSLTTWLVLVLWTTGGTAACIALFG